MRIRQVRPEFFTDAVMAALSPSVRLTYIGLWCVADDAGWFRWDPAQVGAILYPFEPARRRERELTETVAVLQELGRILLYPCGCANIPKLTLHQKIGGTKATSARDAHDRSHAWARKPDVRTLVMIRDQFTCRYCGAMATAGARLILEHVINGGPTTLENCVTACRACNVKKSNRTLEEAGMSLRPEPDQHRPDTSIDSQTHPPVTVGNGRERNGTLETRASANEEPTEFRLKVPRPVTA